MIRRNNRTADCSQGLQRSCSAAAFWRIVFTGKVKSGNPGGLHRHRLEKRASPSIPWISPPRRESTRRRNAILAGSRYGGGSPQNYDQQLLPPDCASPRFELARTDRRDRGAVSIGV